MKSGLYIKIQDLSCIGLFLPPLYSSVSVVHVPVHGFMNTCKENCSCSTCINKSMVQVGVKTKTRYDSLMHNNIIQ